MTTLIKSFNSPNASYELVQDTDGYMIRMTGFATNRVSYVKTNAEYVKLWKTITGATKAFDTLIKSLPTRHA